MTEVDISKALNDLRGYRQRHQDLGKAMFTAYGEVIYPLDLLAAATLHRSMNLLFGFCDLIQNRNMLSAAPLLRLQIDNCARFFASFIVGDPHAFAMSIVKGEHVNKLRDQRGKIMTDAYLIGKLSKGEPWVGKIYRETSGWIHLSDKHIFNALRIGSGNTLQGHIALEDPFIPNSLYLEAIGAFRAATELLFTYISGWIYTKDNPQLVEKAKEEFIKKHGFAPSY